MATTRVVIGGCRSSDDGPLSIRDRSRLTERIVGFYRTAAGRLPSGSDDVLLHGGFCIGILDPVSNIIANAIISSRGSMGTNGATEEATAESSLEGLAARSLDGLVAFLVAYFRYLAPEEALRYLRAARADLCAAVRRVESDRCTLAFRLDSGTARTALRCAALAARHPDPDHMVTTTLTIFYCRHHVCEVLFPPPGCCPSAVPIIMNKKKINKGRLSAAAVEHLRHILTPESQLLMASTRLPPDIHHLLARPLPERPRFIGIRSLSSRLASLTYSLSRSLLNRIHCFYLEALTLLPPEMLGSHYHRSLVIAGHCYGPLDPVSNIILNTVWLEATFPVPMERQFELHMISSSALLRLAHRSVEGMVAFLRAFAGSDLSDLDAYRFLLYADAKLPTSA
ncbi:hypothetical protein QYE76_004613 [Lolium multiflorum]|uniref:PIR2-like helical domain-containing protein n=1 Tax=Lolium multiflorum TaxID=4521 RepID=A0AAD8RR16_LOLMU|nr:hypothetical protein QYE76_004613 [Lolium multiflorum]